MAILRNDEIRNMNREELKDKMKDLKLELAKEKGKTDMGSFPENPGRIKEIKKTVAKILTILKERRSEEEKNE